MLFATISPSISIRKIVDFIDRITSEVVNEDELVRSLGLEPATKPGNANILDERQMGGLPNRHLIGTGEELGDQIVMIIQVQELSSPVLEEGDPADQIYYWRSLTYDQYVGKGWVSRDSVDQEYDPGEKTLSSWPDSYQIIRQKVEFVEDFSSLLFSAGIPLSTNRHFHVAWRVKGSDQKAFLCQKINTLRIHYSQLVVWKSSGNPVRIIQIGSVTATLARPLLHQNG